MVASFPYTTHPHIDKLLHQYMWDQKHFGKLCISIE